MEEEIARLDRIANHAEAHAWREFVLGTITIEDMRWLIEKARAAISTTPN